MEKWLWLLCNISITKVETTEYTPKNPNSSGASKPKPKQWEWAEWIAESNSILTINMSKEAKIVIKTDLYIGSFESQQFENIARLTCTASLWRFQN